MRGPALALSAQLRCLTLLEHGVFLRFSFHLVHSSERQWCNLVLQHKKIPATW